ncbi:P22_AR N-terminal domain-containing protein [Actinopolyspora xinjiangensis]|uniref:P22_AR N-terminal domain-containing protein n=1 Tax=Actinopolyspora xinjiangensis TaxID=405564 RepID=A0A1H0U3I0_9ACTN|nr:phage antirepressor N-terminal domain-containing protein [Actinopolyspora xinjiangensis]SDP60508.1 P22_AR N-terminal domain-containing protein [Actinopolyspora xinjiangensis]
MTESTPSRQLVHIPFHGDDLIATERDGKPMVALKRIADNLGLDWYTQHRKLSAAHWACTVNMTIQLPGDSQSRETAFGDTRTVLMWLATINPAKVADQVRPKLEQYQVEVADVLEQYFTEGGAINPRATEDQLATIVSRAEGQARVLSALSGVVDQSWLDAKGRHVAARALGEEPEVDPNERPLTVGEYLEERGITGAALRSMSTMFGTRLKALFRETYGEEPGTADRFVNGALRPVAVYTERHRFLFDRVWQRYYADDRAA